MSDLPGRLNVISLGARDVPTLRAFYEALGWETRSPQGDFAAFPLGGAVLALYSLELLAAEAKLPVQQTDGFKGFTCAVCVEHEEDVRRALDAARTAGGTVLAEPVKREWGGCSAYFADPEGNAWEIAWLPGGDFDERGGLIWPW